MLTPRLALSVMRRLAFEIECVRENALAMDIFESRRGYEYDYATACLPGNVSEAREVADGALTMLVLRLGKFDPTLSVLLEALAGIELREGRRHQAELTLTRALALAEQLGEHHPYVALPSLTLGQLLLEEGGRGAEAELVLRVAVRSRELHYGGRSHMVLKQSHEYLALALEAQGKVTEALSTSKRAQVICKDVHGMVPDRMYDFERRLEGVLHS